MVVRESRCDRCGIVEGGREDRGVIWCGCGMQARMVPLGGVLRIAQTPHYWQVTPEIRERMVGNAKQHTFDGEICYTAAIRSGTVKQPVMINYLLSERVKYLFPSDTTNKRLETAAAVQEEEFIQPALTPLKPKPSAKVSRVRKIVDMRDIKPLSSSNINNSPSQENVKTPTSETSSDSACVVVEAQPQHKRRRVAEPIAAPLRPGVAIQRKVLSAETLASIPKLPSANFVRQRTYQEEIHKMLKDTGYMGCPTCGGRIIHTNPCAKWPQHPETLEEEALWYGPCQIFTFNVNPRLCQVWNINGPVIENGTETKEKVWPHQKESSLALSAVQRAKVRR
eukprot:TRINITY_DN18663_c0_g1_i3.p1 TRINITY_DN18663_c0_g1~~TRINITY_DN18663_c0_g1_i3.p1  ORF type:complete len:338 (+),score=34.66 TRINITY_DN18663_c0_g1_i3:45-1058(+)